MKIILMIIGTLLAGCSCFTLENDIRKVWSVKFNQCRCQNYSFLEIKELDKLIPCEDFYAPMRANNIHKCQKDSFRDENPELCDRLPNQMYCDDLVGFSAKSWTNNITPHARESKACFEDEYDSKSLHKCSKSHLEQSEAPLDQR